jgi:translation initiation factor 1
MDWKNKLGALLSEDSGFEFAEESACVNQECKDEKQVQTSVLEVCLDKKGRHGKQATIISGFECDDEEVKNIAKELKMKIGTGGSARGGEILLQGDWRDKVVEILKTKKFKVKKI